MRSLIVLTLALAVTPALGQSTAATSTAAHQQFVFAYRLLQRGEDNLAAQAFDDYLGRFPKDEKRGDALFYRAMLARKAGKPEQSIKLLTAAPDPTIVPAYAPPLLLGQAHVDAKQYPQALAVLEPVKLDNLDPATQASLLYLRGVAYRGAGNMPAAAAQLEQVGKLESPLRARALLDLARTQAQLDQGEQAVKTLEQAISLGGPQVKAEAARLAGDLHYKAGRYDPAVAAYQQVLTDHQTSPHFVPAVLGTLWAQLQAGKHAALLKTFETYRESLQERDRALAWYLAGSAHHELGQHDEAAKLLEAVAAGVAGHDVGDKTLYKLAASQFELGRYDAMAQTIERLKSAYADSPLVGDAQFLLAAADARQGDTARGAARLTQIIDAGATHPYYAQALVQRASLYESHGQREAAVEDYKKYIAVTSESSSPQKSWPATLRLIDLLLKLNQNAEAETYAGKLLETKALDAATEQEALYRLMLARINQQQLNGAFDAVQQLMTRHPQNVYAPQARYYRGLLLMGLNKPDEAVSDLLAAADIEALPEAMRANALRLAAVRLREQDKIEDAAQTLTRLEKILGQSKLTPDELLWLGRHHTQSGEAREALRYLLPLLKADVKSQPGAERAESLYLAAQSLSSLGETDAALQALQRVVALGYGFDMQARLQIAQLLEATGKTSEALAEYEGLHHAEQSRIAATALHDSVQIHRRRAAEFKRASDPAAAQAALELAEALLKRLTLIYTFPELEPLPQLSFVELAEVAQELGKPDAAAAALRELADKFPDGPWALYAKALLAVQENRTGDAVFLLKKARETKNLDPQLADRITAKLQSLEGSP